MEASELKGPALDWAVATAAGIPVVIGWSRGRKAPLLDQGERLTLINPSANPEQAGEIIKRANIKIYPDDPVSPKAVIMPDPKEPHYWFRQYGPTDLVAAMRCFVASVLGNDVEIPEELSA